MILSSLSTADKTWQSDRFHSSGEYRRLPLAREPWFSKPVSRILFYAAICLGSVLPHFSSSLPEGRASNPNTPSYLALHRVGFTWQTCHHASGALLPHLFALTRQCSEATPRATEHAVCFLWHLPAGFPDWALPSTLLCGVRTFLSAILNTCLRPKRETQ